MKIIDLSYTLDNSCMTCGTPWHTKVDIHQMGKISEVGRNTHSILLGSHSGTHMDAPLHFFDGTKGIDQTDLEKVCGPCTIVDMTRKQNNTVVELADVKELTVSTRILFRFDWFKNWGNEVFYSEFPYFSVEAANYLVKNGMRVIAMDTPSPDCGKSIGKLDDSPIHKLFLGEDITIIEYLTDTDQLDLNKTHNLFALPLKIRGCDGSPARVIMTEE